MMVLMLMKITKVVIYLMNLEVMEQHPKVLEHTQVLKGVVFTTLVKPIAKVIQKVLHLFLGVRLIHLNNMLKDLEI